MNDNRSYGSLERRKKMIKIIFEYLQEVGVNNFSFRGAAKKADVTTMTLVRYFNNRDGLLDELFNHAMMNATDDFDITANPIKVLTKLIDDENSILYKLDCDNNNVWFQLTLLAESPNASVEMKKRHELGYLRTIGLIASMFEHQGLTNDKAVDLSYSFFSFYQGIFRHFSIHKNKKKAQTSYRYMLTWLKKELNYID